MVTVTPPGSNSAPAVNNIGTLCALLVVLTDGRYCDAWEGNSLLKVTSLVRVTVESVWIEPMFFLPAVSEPEPQVSALVIVLISWQLEQLSKGISGSGCGCFVTAAAFQSLLSLGN